MDELPAPENGTVRREQLQSIATAVLAVVFVVSLTGAAFVAVSPPSTGTSYTELYVLNEDGVAGKYPTNLTVGEAGTVTVGVQNREHESVEYELVVLANDETLGRETATLSHEASWELPITYSFDEPGPVRLRIKLFRHSKSSSDGEPYREVRLLVNVTEAESDDGSG